MAVVAVIVLIAVLFLSGTVMALAVSSSLHTVDIITAQDAVHYAAESAVARGVGAIEKKQTCPKSGDPINQQAWHLWCQADVATKVDASSLQRWAIPAQRLDPGTCVSTSLPVSDSKGVAWAVIAWRGSGDVQVWMDRSPGCSSTGSALCASPDVFWHVRYVTCQRPPAEGAESLKMVLHVGSSDLPADLGAIVIRGAASGPDAIVTVVGRAGVEVDEADLLLPNQVVLWNTVLP
jgi:hypothetical protein